MKLKVTVECLNTNKIGEREVEIEGVHVRGLILVAQGGIENLVVDAVKLAHS
jgi:hypothetical protein